MLTKRYHDLMKSFDTRPKVYSFLSRSALKFGGKLCQGDYDISVLLELLPSIAKLTKSSHIHEER